MGLMKTAVAVLMALALLGCTPPADPPAPSEAAKPVEAAAPSEAAARRLPAADESGPPSLKEFARQAQIACADAQQAIAAVELQGDPFVEGASPVAVGAAVARFRAAESAWSGAAEHLWQFGLPRRKLGEQLMNAFDVIAQYSHQAAGLLEEGDTDRAQLVLDALETSTFKADRLASALGAPSLFTCAAGTPELAGARKVDVVATEFAFTAGPLRPGPTHFVVRNRGAERHQLSIVRLRRAGTLDDAVATDEATQDPSGFVRGAPVSSPIVRRGRRTTLDVNLERGTYGLVCFLASPDATPHAYKGMVLEITVAR